MARGVIGFGGSRLREAREARGLTGVSLAELADISGAQISQYESGKRTPPPEVVQKLAQSLNLPIAFFLRDGANPEAHLAFRSLSAATKAARTKERRRFEWLVLISDFVREYARLPSVDFPPTPTVESPLELEDDEIEDAAGRVRDYWEVGQGPVPDLIGLLEQHGAIVSRFQLGADKLDAYSGWVDDVPYVVLSADKRAAVRTSYDAAHELGHLILHRGAGNDALSSTVRVKELERQANVFAGAFLLPAEAFAGELLVPTLDAFLSIKPKWMVSVGAMIKRAGSLDLINEQQERRLWIAYRRRWGRREPFDDELRPEEAAVLRSAFELSCESGRLSIASIRTGLPYADGDIEQLAGLPRRFLSGAVSGTTTFHDPDEISPGNLLRFPSREADSSSSRIAAPRPPTLPKPL